jgi:hypothetical protein
LLNEIGPRAKMFKEDLFGKGRDGSLRRIEPTVVWGIRRRPRLSSVLRLVTMAIIGIILLVVLQVGNN